VNETDVRSFWQDIVPQWALCEALFYAANVRLADVIGDGPTELEMIATRTGTDRGALRRLLNALAANGIFERVDGERFAPNALSRPLRSDVPESQRAYLALGSLIIHGAWTALEGTMRTGRPAFEIQYGAPTFEYFKSRPDLAAAFAEGMTSTTRRAEQALMASAPFGGFDRVVDVGGSFGSLVRLLLGGQPRARGIVFDRPEIAEEASRRWSGAPDAERLSAVGGDFFQSVPPGADLYLLKQILHDWPDEQCVTILRNVRAATPERGRIAIVEMVLPDGSAPHPGWMYDLLMMTMTGGRERTGTEYRGLLSAAGFDYCRTITTASPLSVIEARPAPVG
jgi:O-methyltransferase domain